MANQKSKTNSRKQLQFFRSTIPFLVIIIAISGLIAYLWIYSDVDETLKELEIQQTTLAELNEEISNLEDDIEYFTRVDVLTSKARRNLGMVFTAPETISIYVDN